MDIDFIENPEVGKFYLVPCIRAPFDARRWLSVMPHAHTDKQFTGTRRGGEHYHYDLRFFSETEAAGLEDFERIDKIPRTSFVAWKSTITEIRVLRKKCRAEFAGIGKAQRLSLPAQTWYAEQIGKSCAGAVCPHYKQPMFRREDGKLECPYHGLIGDAATEKIIGSIHDETHRNFQKKVLEVINCFSEEIPNL